MRRPVRLTLLAVVAGLAACQADRLVGVHLERGAAGTALTPDAASLDAARLPPCGPAAEPAPAWRRSRLRVASGAIQVPPGWRRGTPDDSTEFWMARDTSAVVLIQRSDPLSFIRVTGIDGYVVILGGSRCAGLLAGVAAPYQIARFAPRRGASEPMSVAQADLRTAADRAVHLLVLGRGAEGFAQGMAVLAALRLAGWSPPTD